MSDQQLCLPQVSKNVPMKASGVDWIGEVPSHWDMRRFKDFGSFATGRDHSHLLNGSFPVFGSSRTPFAYVDRPLSTRTALAIGRKGTVDKPFLLPSEFWAVDTCMFFRPLKSILSLMYSFYWTNVIPWLQYSTQTALPSLTQTTVNNINIPLPPLPEQVAIAAYLDKTTALIDKQRAFLERKKALFQEHKKALIHEAVTKGLQAGVPMKASGVDWIGEVPSHWQIRRVKEVTTCLDSKRVPISAQDRETVGGTTPYWGANNIVDYVKGFLVDEDVVLLGEDGAPFLDKTKDVAFFSRGKIWPNNHIHVLRPASFTQGSFLRHSLNCVNYSSIINGSTRMKLTQSEMNLIEVPCPSIVEQVEIAGKIDEISAIANRYVELIEGKIELLAGLRASIIHETVTKGVPV